MITITKLEQKTFQGKPSGFTVTLSDGTTGNLHEKESDKGLRVGDPVTVTITPYTSKQGKTSNLVGLRLANSTPTPTPAPPTETTPSRPQIHVGAGKSIHELKADAAIKASELMVNLFIQDKIDWGQLEEKQKYLSQLLWSEIDDIFSKK